MDDINLESLEEELKKRAKEVVSSTRATSVFSIPSVVSHPYVANASGD